jgi:hypothetical protein
MDPDPAIFASDLQDANNKLFLQKNFLLLIFGRFIYIILHRNSHKEVTKQ